MYLGAPATLQNGYCYALFEFLPNEVIAYVWINCGSQDGTSTQVPTRAPDVVLILPVNPFGACNIAPKTFYLYTHNLSVAGRDFASSFSVASSSTQSFGTIASFPCPSNLTDIT